MPVRVKTTHQIKSESPASDSVRSGKALLLSRAKLPPSLRLVTCAELGNPRLQRGLGVFDHADRLHPGNSPAGFDDEHRGALIPPVHNPDDVMDIEFLKQQAERCRRLAKGTDPFTEKRLLKLAEEYEAQIKELEKRNS